MGKEEILHGPSVLTQDIGQLYCILTVVLAGLLMVYSRLIGCMTMSVFIKFGLAILCSGATINDRDKSERSNVG